jgi:hypothetical protein
MTRYAITLLAVLVSVPAYAAPTYLVCLIDDGEKVSQIDVTADEAIGQVSLHVPSTGYAAKMQAVFRANDVVFGDQIARYRIDRQNLTIEQSLTMLKGDLSKGTCKVEKVVKRAF